MFRKTYFVFLVAALLTPNVLAEDDRNRREDDGNKKRSSGSVKGDPVLTAFDGQEFEFHGIAGHHYNLASLPGVFQLSTLLKPAVMFDHNGTYMKGVAFWQSNARVVVETGADFEEEIKVYLNGKQLSVESVATESTTKTFTLKDGSKFELLWKLHAPEVGPLVQIRTDDIYVVLSLTAPFPDAGGVLQPNYLNANVTLLREPSKDLQGVLGETYNVLRARSGDSIVKAPSYPLYDESKYEIQGYFGATISQTMAELMKQLTIIKPSATVAKK
eukprot:jgi/Botrbrau1/16204/Bobra.160_1s0005.1